VFHEQLSIWKEQYVISPGAFLIGQLLTPVLPRSYLGLAVPDMPNFLTFIGPTWPVENGSVMGPLGYVGNYAIKMIKKMQNEFIKSITPKQEMTDLFNAHTQEFIKQTVWSGSCRSWYKSKWYSPALCHMLTSSQITRPVV
jgi:hypothetical protein